MANKNIRAIAIVVLFSFSFIIATPIILFTVSFSSYDVNNASYYREISSSTPIEKLYFKVDEGNLMITYADLPTDTSMTIDVNIELAGSTLVGKNYTDYLNINWQLNNSTLNFALEIMSESWFDRSLWFIQNIDILATIRKDIIVDIITHIKRGDYEIRVPWGVSIDNVFTNVSNGKTKYDYSYCTIGGNITGLVNIGNLELKLLNTQYSRNSFWAFTVQTGDIYVEILQEKEMDFNVTGVLNLITGKINMTYSDDTSDIGAYYYFPVSGYQVNNIVNHEGFDPDFVGPYFKLISHDFPAKGNYNLTIYIHANPLYSYIDVIST